MTAVDREPAPDWLTDLLAEHDDWLNSEDGSSATCDCGLAVSMSNSWTDCDDAHRAHVAAVVWAAITERVRIGFDVTPDYTGFRSVTETHLLAALGGSHE